MLKIIQLSDCHLPESRDTLYRGEDSWSALEMAAECIREYDPHAIVVTGDISEQAGRESYHFFQQTLARLWKPVYCLNGNHDRRDVMRQVLDQPLSLTRQVPLGNWRFHFLDSAHHDRIHGELSPQQIDQLALAIDQQEEDWALLFLHHQPMLCGSDWIDRYPLVDPEPLLELVNKRVKVRGVCWGHIHHAWEMNLQHCQWLGCPSTGFTALAGKERPEKDPKGPACRWLELGENGLLQTGILQSVM